MTSTAPLTKKDFKSDQEVRWCPGCGDYGILNAVQSAFAERMDDDLIDAVHTAIEMMTPIPVVEEDPFDDYV